VATLPSLPQSSDLASSSLSQLSRYSRSCDKLEGVQFWGKDKYKGDGVCGLSDTRVRFSDINYSEERDSEENRMFLVAKSELWAAS